MTHQERFIASMTFGRPDRYILWQLFGLMPGVLEKWISEGMPEPQDGTAPLEFFGFDPQPTGIPVNTSAYPGFKPEVIEDNDEFAISKDGLGRTIKLIKSAASIPLPLDWPVAGPEDWAALKNHFAYCPERFAPDWLDRYSNARSAGLPVVICLSGFYHFPRQLMGDQQLAYSYYDHPDMIEDIQNTYTDMICAVAEEIGGKAQIDAVYLGEDMAYDGGSMISDEHFDRFLAPYYRRVIAAFRNQGVKIFAVDSDGYVEDLIPKFLQVGVNAMYPFEVHAKNDIVRIRKRHGQSLAMIGGLDKFCVTDGRSAIDRELDSKLPQMTASAGYIASLDHRITIETPFEDYLYYVEQAKRRLGIPG